MAHDTQPAITQPAITRNFEQEDREAIVCSTPTSTVTHNRGWGDSGYRVEVVEYECPADHCSFDRMVRRVDISPEHPPTVKYWCLNPNCVHYLRDVLSYAFKGSYPQRRAREPAVTGDE